MVLTFNFEIQKLPYLTGPRLKVPSWGKFEKGFLGNLERLLREGWSLNYFGLIHL